ncbi:hypothetical protein ABE488_00870 [Luteimonas sp. TWI662]|uniref:hypothetical protein n=1 Tax=Luteimonas sp. TWI662 TaxID=3136789 RepID=UPI00320797BE
MSLDHGILNVPLAKRGNIDAQLDAYKANQTRDARARAKADAVETKALRVKARGLVAAADPAMLERVASNAGIALRELRTRLNSDAHWKPAWVIRVLGGAA